MNFFVLKPSLRPGLIDSDPVNMDFFGLASGELGLECGEPGTRVSELTYVLSATGLVTDPTSVSDDAPMLGDVGTLSASTGLSVDDSPGTELNVIQVRPLVGADTDPDAYAARCRWSPSSGDSELSSDSVTSVKNSLERVSHEAIGANFCLVGINRLVVCGSSNGELLPCLASGLGPFVKPCRPAVRLNPPPPGLCDLSDSCDSSANQPKVTVNWGSSTQEEQACASQLKDQNVGLHTQVPE